MLPPVANAMCVEGKVKVKGERWRVRSEKKRKGDYGTLPFFLQILLSSRASAATG